MPHICKLLLELPGVGKRWNHYTLLQWQNTWRRTFNNWKFIWADNVGVQSIMAGKAWKLGRSRWLHVCVMRTGEAWVPCSRTFFIFNRGPIYPHIHSLPGWVFLNQLKLPGNILKICQMCPELCFHGDLNPVKLTVKVNNYKRKEKLSYPCKIQMRASFPFAFMLKLMKTKITDRAL